MVEVTSPVRGSRDCPPVRAMCTGKPWGGKGDGGSAHNDEQDAAVDTKSERLYHAVHLPYRAGPALAFQGLSHRKRLWRVSY